MTPETLARARWHQNGPYSWILKQPIKDGSTVLATVVHRAPNQYTYTTHTVPIQIGAELSARDAKSAARKALREASDVRDE